MIELGHALEKKNYISKFNYNYTSASNIRCRSRARGSMKDDDGIVEVDASEYLGQPVTFVIPQDNIDQLQYESDTKQVSLNTRINQIIKDHLDWHSDAPDAKIFYLPKSFMMKTVNQLNEQQLSSIAQSIVSDLQETSLLLRGEFSFPSFLDILNTWSRIAKIPHRIMQDEYEYKIIIRHEMGSKYSYFLKEVCKYVIEERFHIPTSYKITDNTLLLRIKK